MTSQDVLTMTGCRCPKLAGRASNFFSRDTSHFKVTAVNLTETQDVRCNIVLSNEEKRFSLKVIFILTTLIKFD